MVPNKQMNALHFAGMARKHACLIPLFGRPKAVLALLQPQGKGSYCPVQRNQQHVFIFCLKKKERNQQLALDHHRMYYVGLGHAYMIDVPCLFVSDGSSAQYHLKSCTPLICSLKKKRRRRSISHQINANTARYGSYIHERDHPFGK
jgi:hypothetical protein